MLRCRVTPHRDDLLPCVRIGYEHHCLRCGFLWCHPTSQPLSCKALNLSLCSAPGTPEVGASRLQDAARPEFQVLPVLAGNSACPVMRWPTTTALKREPRKGSGVRAVILSRSYVFSRSRVNTSILGDLSQRCPNIHGSHPVNKKNVMLNQLISTAY